MKRCNQCKRWKPLGDFHARKDSPDGRQHHCKVCSREGNRTRQLKTHYGLTPAKYDEMFEAQGRACAICSREPLSGKHLAVDHDHTTNAVRGLLCDHCNHALGKFEDRAEWLRNAADYLDMFAFADV